MILPVIAKAATNAGLKMHLEGALAFQNVATSGIMQTLCKSIRATSWLTCPTLLLFCPMYPKQFFIEQFSDIDTEDLLVKLSSDELVDNAKAAIRDILAARGTPVTEITRLSKEAHRAEYKAIHGATACEYCTASARRNPVLDEGQRFCSTTCLYKARLSEAAVDLTQVEIELAAGKIRAGACPLCDNRTTPVEVRSHYTVVSVIFMSNYETKSKICCLTCARKDNRKSMLISFFLGWWGIPWGFIFTPAALFGNLMAMFAMRGADEPSEALRKEAKYQLALAALKKSEQIKNLGGAIGLGPR
ncbi:hypothetical protein [Undibacterium sp. TJN19]|uniref:hypothetical protein n=1 Tax=Undibacterium sp. TJN19 TaxID=3413055 RepID=UPI003BF28B59